MNPFERLPIEKQARIVNASISEFAEKGIPRIDESSQMG